MAHVTAHRLFLILAVLVVSLLAMSRTSEASCVTPPISRERLNSAIAQPAEPFAGKATRDQGIPVDGDLRRQVEDVLGQVVACSNAGEPLRVWALYSDAYLSRLFQIQGQFTEEQYAAFALPRPTPGGSGMRLEVIERVRRRADGLVVAQVVTRYPSVPMPKRLLFWFAVDGGGVEIEEVTGEISFSLP